MTLVLSDTDLTQLAAAQEALLSPLAFQTPVAWQAEVRQRVRTLLGADKSISVLPLADGQHILPDPEQQRAVDEYIAYYHQKDPGVVARRRELGLEVADIGDLYDLRTFPNSELMIDWGAPHGLYDCVMMAVDLDPSIPYAGVLAYHDEYREGRFGERGLSLLRLLVPALRAGVRSCRQYIDHRTDLLRVLDQLGMAVLATTLDGSTIHEAPTLAAMLSEDPERQRVLDLLRRTASFTGAVVARRKHTCGASRPMLRAGEEQHIRTASARYRAFVTYLPSNFSGAPDLVLVTLERVATDPPTDEELQVRYGLTTRELDVVRLLREGTTTDEIARQMRISTYTARHHLEHVQTKLGVRSRAEAVARLNAH